MKQSYNRKMVGREPEGNIFTECDIRIRFNEIDALGIVWHGHYFRFFEDGRESFGKLYGIDYMSIYELGYSIPLVEMHCFNLKPLKYGDDCVLRTTYISCPSAKIVFEYHLYKLNNGKNTLVATGRTVQVFVNRDGTLELIEPAFYKTWKSELSI